MKTSHVILNIDEKANYLFPTPETLRDRCGNGLSFTELYQINHGYNSFLINMHYDEPVRCESGPNYDTINISSLNINCNQVVRWVEGFETLEIKEILGKKYKQINTIFTQEYISIYDAVSRTELRSGIIAKRLLLKKKSELEKLQKEISTLEESLNN